MPLYVYKNVQSFRDLVAEYVRTTLREGLFGWEVTDCTVTLTHCGYAAPSTTASDFRKLTPLVLMHALERARTEVCEPIARVSLELPDGHGRSRVLPPSHGSVPLRRRRRPRPAASPCSRRCCPQPACRSFGGGCRR